MRVRSMLALSALLFAAGCVSPSDPLGHRDDLEEAQKRYTDMIRWRDAERAAKFVEPDLREKFLSYATALETLEISDYEIGEIQYEDDDRTAHIDVTYRGYSLAHLVERKVRVTQEWHRAEGSDWLVRPDLEAVVAQLRGTKE